MAKAELRIKSVGTKVTETEYGRREDAFNRIAAQIVSALGAGA